MKGLLLTKGIVLLKEKFLGVLDKKKPRLSFLNGEFFFYFTTTLAKELSPSEWEFYLELELEQVSPFNLDQLYWGYMVDPEAEKACVYALLKSKALLDDQQNLIACYPSFILGFGHYPSASPLRLIRFEGTLSALQFKESTLFPKEIFSAAIPESQALETPFQALQLLKLAGFDGEGSSEFVSFYHITSIKIDPNNIIHFEAREVPTASIFSRTLFSNASSSWSADIRDSFYLKQLKKSQALSKKLWKAFTILAFATVCLLGIQILLWGSNTWLKWQNKILKRNEAQELQLQNKNFLTEKILQVSGQELRPFLMLEVLNQYRPDEIHFTSAQADNYHNLVIEGSSTNVNLLNQFVQQLRESESFDQIELSNISSQKQQVTFTLLCDFNGPFLQSKLTEQTEEEKNEDAN